MLEPWIIEQIRRREEEQRRRNERPQLEIPSGDERSERWHNEDPDRRDKDGGESEGEDRDRKKDDQPERGVMIIDFGV